MRKAFRQFSTLDLLLSPVNQMVPLENEEAVAKWLESGISGGTASISTLESEKQEQPDGGA